MTSAISYSTCVSTDTYDIKDTSKIQGGSCMAEKVKMSVFLDAEVARAAKVQAARQGADGVSQLVRAMFTCAHCDEPIAGDFVVGIKMTAPGTFGVFFHADR